MRETHTEIPSLKSTAPPPVCHTAECVLTAGEDEWTGVLVHWEVVKLQLALSVYCQPVKGRNDIFFQERLNSRL